MRVQDLRLAATLAARKEAVVGAWLARTLRSYPDHTVRFLLEQRDAFRNPVGHALRQGLPALFDELAGDMDAARIRAVLDELVRIRAVQDFTPSQAVGFVFLLKDVLREQGALEAELERRIDQMALAAFDQYMQCREKLAEIKVGEARRAAGAANRAATARERLARGERS